MILLFDTFKNFKFFKMVESAGFDDIGSDQISVKSQLLMSNSVRFFNGKNIRGEMLVNGLPAKFS